MKWTLVNAMTVFMSDCDAKFENRENKKTYPSTRTTYIYMDTDHWSD